MAVDSLRDMEILLDGIDPGVISTSMTINGPASIMFGFYLANAEKRGVPFTKLRGTLQNDILKEYIAQKCWCFPPRPSLRIIVDLIEFATRHVPQWNTISVSGYHIREAGSTAAQELAFTLADGFTYVEECVAARPRRRRLRAAAVVLLEQPPRLLRGDRQAERARAASGRGTCASASAPSDASRG